MCIYIYMCVCVCVCKCMYMPFLLPEKSCNRMKPE